jgi:hypothetical protein
MSDLSVNLIIKLGRGFLHNNAGVANKTLATFGQARDGICVLFLCRRDPYPPLLIGSMELAKTPGLPTK